MYIGQRKRTGLPSPFPQRRCLPVAAIHLQSGELAASDPASSRPHFNQRNGISSFDPEVAKIGALALRILQTADFELPNGRTLLCFLERTIHRSVLPGQGGNVPFFCKKLFKKRWLSEKFLRRNPDSTPFSGWARHQTLYLP
jgi:hypothetical protein